MSSLRRIVGINTNLNLQDERLVEISIGSKRSLLDFDTVVINASKLTEYGYCQKEYKSLRLLDAKYTEQIKSDFSSLKNQLEKFLKQGKNVYIFVGEDDGCYIDQKNIVGEYEFIPRFSFLPIKNIFSSTLIGDTFELVANQYKSLFDKFKADMVYKAVLESKAIEPIVKIPNSDSIIGGRLECFSGNIIFLPYVSVIGSRGKNLHDKKKDFFETLYDFDDRLNTKENQSVEIPKWVDDFVILGEEKEKLILEKKRKALLDIQREISLQEEKLATLKKYKSILTSTGPDLEDKVKEIFTQLGFQLRPSKKGRCDIIAKYNNKDIVVEVKGLTKSASEDNTMQLEKWVIEFNDAEKKIPKSILLVNGFLKLPLDARKEVVFPSQMQKLSKGRGQCLITTTQLLCLFIEVSENPKCRDSRLTELLNTEGVYSRYTNYSRFIKKVK